MRAPFRDDPRWPMYGADEIPDLYRNGHDEPPAIEVHASEDERTGALGRLPIGFRRPERPSLAEHAADVWSDEPDLPSGHRIWPSWVYEQVIP